MVWKVLGESGDTVLKLYRTKLRNPMFRNDAQLEALCLRAFEQEGFVPRLQATGQHQGDAWVLYDHAPGRPWESGTAQVASLLRKLHGSTVDLPLPSGRNGSADLARHGAELLALCSSDFKDRVTAMRPDDPVSPTKRTCLIHGDPVAGNILVDGSNLTLIDWQCPAIGDPCEDLALFLSPAMQHLYRGVPLNPDEHARFLTEYGDLETVARYEALRPWYAWRMAAYCLWRFENGSTDYEKGLQLELEALEDHAISE
jgi:aminoglycoside phosphotransferase (APT) family kinase protein